MSNSRPESSGRFLHLKRFLQQNASIDFCVIDLGDSSAMRGLCWSSLEAERQAILEQLKSYQRLARITPPRHSDAIFTFLEKNNHSAMQIAAMPRQQFISTYLDLFDNDHRAIEAAYQRALVVRSDVFRRYLDIRQQHEIHARMARIDAK